MNKWNTGTWITGQGEVETTGGTGQGQGKGLQGQGQGAGFPRTMEEEFYGNGEKEQLKEPPHWRRRGG